VGPRKQAAEQAAHVKHVSDTGLKMNPEQPFSEPGFPHLVHFICCLPLLFDPEIRGSMLLQNVSDLLDYMTSHPRSYQSSLSLLLEP
jgi:hypothetical protein